MDRQVIVDSMDQLVKDKWPNLSNVTESYAIANIVYCLKILAYKYNIPSLASHGIYLGNINTLSYIEQERVLGDVLSNI